MEAGINADQNFYRRQFPQSSEDPQVGRKYEEPPQRDFDPRPPQPPPKVSLVTNNIQVVTANGYGAGAVNTPIADDFYRSFRGIPSSPEYDEINTNGMLTATQPGTASRQTPSSFRSNSNGTTPKHPTISASRNALKPSYRSASAPLDERMALSTAKSTPALKGPQQPSVKDLLKRFDQNNEQTSSASRRTPIRTPINENGTASFGYMRSRSNVESQSVLPASRAGMMTRDTMLGRAKSPSTIKTTQRSKFATEDQHSNNALSSIARATRSRQDLSGNKQATQSMTDLAPASPAKPPSPAFGTRVLFGEIITKQSGPTHPGFGIAESRVRREPDGSLSQPPLRPRSQSDADVPPSSPTSWYLGASSGPSDDLDVTKTPRPSRQHNRAQSDFGVEKVTSTGSRPLETRDRYKSPPSEFKQSSQSRLPLSSKRLSTPSESASPPSTRSASPSKLKASAVTTKISKVDSRPWSPAGRSTTPSDRSKTPAGRSTPSERSKTPAGGSTTPTNKPITSYKSPGRQIASPPKIPINSSSLKAYISAPPPKTSPPLRSSRPRLPVSSATTASSRGKVAEKSDTSQQQASPRTTRSGGHDGKQASRIRAPGPVDFAAYRETIQRNVSISIKEGEEKKLQAARLRRLAAERAMDKTAEEANGSTENNPDAPETFQMPVQIVVEEAQSPRLEVQTSFPSSGTTFAAWRHESESTNLDSPTLGVPGSYPSPDLHSDVDDPHSAISNATGFTEFDTEPQTEAASHAHRIPLTDTLRNDLPTETLAHKLSIDNSVHSPSENVSIPIILDTSSVSEAQPVTSGDCNYENQNHSGNEPSNNEYGYGAPVFSSTSPIESLDDHSLPPTIGPTEQSLFEKDCSPINVTPTITQYPNHIPSGDVHVPRPQAKVPLWNREQQTQPKSSSFSLPTLETTNVNSTFQPELVQTPITEIDSESSGDIEDDGDAGDDSNFFEEHYERPFNHTPQYGVSQKSGWADNTVNTVDEPTWGVDRNYLPPLPLFSSRDEPPQPPPKEEFAKPEVPPKPPNYSPLPSPRSTGDTPRIASPSRTFKSDQSLNSNRRSSEPSRSLQDVSAVPPVPAWPDHSPPPPPQGAFTEMISLDSARSPPPPSLNNRRPVSSVYRSNRDPESRRESNDDLASSRPSISTPLSSTRISLNDDVAQAQQFDEPFKAIPLDGEEKEAAEKLAKRLQHRGRVIKELIDTESVYLKDMNVVEEIYKGTAEACPRLEPGDVKTIFRNTDQIVAFSTMFLDELKAASASVYSPRLQKSRQSRNAVTSPNDDRNSMSAAPSQESDLEKDHKTHVGEYFGRHLKEMQNVYTDFLKSSEQASARLAILQSDSAVKVWLNECNHVAKDLTAAWDLDALLIKPVQRITRYQLLLKQLLELTPDDHPDRRALQSTLGEVGSLLKSIDDLKKRIDTVNKIVGRKRKESDVRFGLAKAFGRSREKSLASSSSKFADDEVYLKLYEKFGDDYLRLQVVLRDVEFYTRQSSTYVNDFLRFLSSIELVMRVSPSPYPELESKWARFNMSMRDMGTVALEDHVSLVRKKVIEPFEQVIKMYGPPDIVMKKRKKRRLDYERSLTLKASNKKVDEKLAVLVEEYEGLNETLKFELPKLSACTEKVGNLCLIQFVSIQVEWLRIWQEKVKAVLEANQIPKDVEDILEKFNCDYKYHQARIQELSIANGALLEDMPKGRLSQSTTATREDDSSSKSRGPPPLPLFSRSRGQSINSDHSPSLPTPDFAKRHSGQFTFSPIVPVAPNLQFSTRDFPPLDTISRGGSGSPSIIDAWMASKPYSTRPNPRLSYDSGGLPRTSVESGEAISPSGSAYYSASQALDNLPASSRPFSGLFHSALPTDDTEESRRSSRASSRDRNRSGGYNVLYWAASLFEFNISATKAEAGYPYLTYGAGEIFDVIGEKGELWLAKNQDDPTNRVGWIWSKHFARLAD